jgi:hypothetical protein
MQTETGNWTDYRTRFNLHPEDEIDLHSGRRVPHVHRFYGEQVEDLEQRLIESLRQARADGRS